MDNKPHKRKHKPWVETAPQRLRVSVMKRLNKLSQWFSRRALDQREKIALSQKEPSPGKVFDENGITVILNVYARPEYLDKQVKAIRTQSVPPTEIWIWNNSSGEPQYDFSEYCDRLVLSNYNWKFFGRFALGLMAQTKYVAFIDDDVIPGSKWFKNCLTTIRQDKYNGILGGVGARFTADDYDNKEVIGWLGTLSDTPQEVDTVGQSWFMKKEHLRYMWYEEPYTYNNGEDMHLSYTTQKYGGVKKFVPPHPKSDKDLWSAKPIISSAWNKDPKGSSTGNKQEHNRIRNEIVSDYRRKGWRFQREN